MAELILRAAQATASIIKRLHERAGRSGSALVILSGIPGSGKSTFVNRLRQGWEGTFDVCSADLWHTDKQTGEYRYRAAEARLAHGQCFRDCYRVAAAYGDPEGVRAEAGHLLVVDNTNLSAVEIAPYRTVGDVFGWDVVVVRVVCPVEVAHARQTHGVPTSRLLEMHKRFMAVESLPWQDITVEAVIGTLEAA